MGLARHKGGKTIRKDKILEIANSIWEILIQMQYIVCLEVTFLKEASPMRIYRRENRMTYTDICPLSSEEPMF